MKIRNKVLKAGFALPLLSLSAISMAQQAPASASAGDNALWIVIIGTMAALLLVILILGKILLAVARMAAEKRKKLTAAAVMLLLFITNAVSAQATQPVSNEGKLFFDWALISGGIVLLAEGIVIVMFSLQIRSLLNYLSDKKEERKPIEVHLPRLFDSINASVAVEQEEEVMTDHEYDGIRELDNNLPPWWKYGFYFTILYAVVYLFYYHGYGAPGSSQEYETEMKTAMIAKEEYLRKNALNVDESNVKMADIAGIAEGRTIYENNCATCHGKIGEGTVGPNLTDDYWLHGGNLNEVFKSVKYGWPAKGMKSWQMDLSPAQIRDVCSYIKTLRGTNPPMAKAAQGEFWVEGPSAVDSVKMQ